MFKKVFLLLTFTLFISLQAGAVLKERNIDRTLSILRTELTTYRMNLEKQTGYMRQQSAQVRNNLIEAMNKSQQNSLMLYSQRTGFIFDLTYACHEATEQFREFQKNVLPFKNYITSTNTEIARYDSLIGDLSKMYVQGLSPQARIDRNVCLTLAVNIRHTLKDNREQMNEYITYYESTEQRLRYLNDYANKRYKEIQDNIFSNGGDDYITIMANMHHNLVEAKDVAVEKYRPLQKVNSDWDSRVLLGLFSFIVGFGLIAIFLNFISVRLLLNRLVKSKRITHFFGSFFNKREDRTVAESLIDKRSYILGATTVITFALLLGIVRIIKPGQSFLLMASGLLVEYAWLLSVILISLIIRLDGEQVKSGFKVYAPLVVVGFIVISFRVVLIPNDIVNLVFPPTLLMCALWQWYIVSKLSRRIPKSDAFYTYISLSVFLASVISSWLGYTLLAVQLLIWWIGQLTCILTITCIQGILKRIGEERLYFSKETSINKVWFFRLIYYVALPIAGVFSVVFSLYWAADVFNLSDTTWHIFQQRLIDSKNFTFSIFGAAEVITLYFVFKYINSTSLEYLEYHFKQIDPTNYTSRTTMIRNVMQVIVWGVWLLVSLNIFNVSNTWLVVVSGGLSTGIGFAMKDILENIYYGISLMAGRIKIGDYIQCDGIRGKVSSISYTSTMMDTIDGSVIAFQNSQLFTKNYKNLTKNHGYELKVIPIGVAYGSNPKQVRELLIEAINKLDCRDKEKPVKIVFRNLGESSIDFTILVWVPVLTEYHAYGEILETVYNTLNEHHIEIPFPQRDVHIITADSDEEAFEKMAAKK